MTTSNSRPVHSTYDFRNISIGRPLGRSVQTKLAVSLPGDVLEQEADRVADQVLAKRPVPLHLGGGHPEPHRSTTSDDAFGRMVNSPGRPLDLTTRAFFEPRFGHDFSRVCVHDDSAAAASARSLNALAYTIGRHVVWGHGQVTPGTDAGRKLLAHELAHVLQQSRGDTQVQRQVAPVSGDLSFSDRFKAGFAAILPEFFGEDSLSDEEIDGLFTAEQRSHLLRFLEDHLIPPRLFIDAEAISPRLTVGRRLLLSAYILSTGNIQRLVNGNVIADKPRALFCGHWVQGVWIYAGLNPAESTAAAAKNTKMSSVGLTGEISFGTGKPTSSLIGAPDRSLPTWADHKVLAEKFIASCADVSARNAKAQAAFLRKASTCGPGPDSSELPPIASPVLEKCTAEPEIRRQAIPDVLALLEPGDWIWVYNGNASAHHSMMFATWMDGEEGSHVRSAKVFDQGTPGVFGDPKKPGGGRSHTVTLTDDLNSTDPKHLPVVHLSRVGSGLPARTEQSLIGIRPSTSLVDAAIDTGMLDRRSLWNELSLRARGELARLSFDLSDPQRKMFYDIWRNNSNFDDEAAEPTSQNISTLVVVLEKLMFRGKITGVPDAGFLKFLRLDGADLERLKRR